MSTSEPPTSGAAPQPDAEKLAAAMAVYDRLMVPVYATLREEFIAMWCEADALLADPYSGELNRLMLRAKLLTEEGPA